MNVMNIVESFNNQMALQLQNNSRKPVGVKAEENKQTNLKPEDIKSAVAALNRLVINFNEKVQFALDDKTNKVIIKFIDKDTNEVISEIPSKYSLKLLEHFQESMGLFVDESR
ncbi:MAG TPA: flagellar protein FlaG [Spirochaetota bacterium]|jgi:flagellar protein FlaG|nr:flagellar protein FlaG [Spirochaetota bacterium]HOQ12244.1 flagellar protein FlaG [Spirochaetota bacterium]HOV07589.1 flagellar protein FlaG [Spirochaetota bacterium]